MVGEVREYDELAGIYEKLDTVRIPTSTSYTRILLNTSHSLPGNSQQIVQIQLFLIGRRQSFSRNIIDLFLQL